MSCNFCGYIAEAWKKGTRFPAHEKMADETDGKYKDFTSSFLLHEDPEYKPSDEPPNGKWVSNLLFSENEGQKKFKVIEKC